MYPVLLYVKKMTKAEVYAFTQIKYLEKVIFVCLKFFPYLESFIWFML